MARYVGPVCKLCRRHGEKLMLKGDRCDAGKCAVEKRSGLPGKTARARRRKISERGVQLLEKQKARHIYGVLERQFRKHFAEAERRPGVTGENLLQILETRLDNVIFRLGFGDSRSQARQLVCHGHFALNGRKTDIPSASVKPGDVITVMPTSKKLGYFDGLSEVLNQKQVPAWLSLDAENLGGRVLAVPARTDIDSRISEQIITEYYSR